VSAVYPLQNSFAGGEISPRLSARVDTERYRQSVAEFTNFYSTPQGSAFRRAGSQFMWSTLNNGPARLIQFSLGRENDYVVEFTDGNVRMFNRDGIVQAAGGEELANPEFSEGADGLAGWDITSYLIQPTIEQAETIDKTVMEITVGSPALVVTQLEGAIGEGGIQPPNPNFYIIEQSVEVDEDPLNPGTWLPHTLSTDYLWGGDGNLFTVRMQIGDGVTEIAYADVTYTEAGTGNGSFPETFTPLTATVTVKYEFRLSTTPTVDPNFVRIQNLSLRPEINDPLILASPYSGAQLAELDTAMDLGGDLTEPDRLWIVHPDVEPHLLTRVSRNDWTLAPVAFTMPPPAWSAGNYPAQVELTNARSWFTGVPSDRTRIFGSKAGDYRDFTTGSNPGDALDLNLVTRGVIQWLKGQKTLVLGTDLTTNTLTGGVRDGTSQPYAVGNIDVLEQSSDGSARIEPRIIGTEVVYVSPDATKLYAMDYSRDINGWASNDLTWVSEHITKESRGDGQNGILRVEWVRDPDNQIQMTMLDGTVKQCVYDKRHETLSWSTYETDGSYTDMCVTDDLGGSSKWYCIKRGDNYYIETIQAGEINNQYSDSWVAKATVNKVVDGLGHLEGKTVQVTVSGAREPDKVVTGGEITTEFDGNAVVGLAYTATMKTLRTEGGNPAGTSQASVMDFSNLILRLNDSAVPSVNGQRPALRSPLTPMGVPTPRLSGDTETFHVDFETQGAVTIEQDYPFRTEILAIYGKLRSNTL